MCKSLCCTNVSDTGQSAVNCQMNVAEICVQSKLPGHKIFVQKIENTGPLRVSSDPWFRLQLNLVLCARSRSCETLHCAASEAAVETVKTICGFEKLQAWLCVLAVALLQQYVLKVETKTSLG